MCPAPSRQPTVVAAKLRAGASGEIPPTAMDAARQVSEPTRQARDSLGVGLMGIGSPSGHGRERTRVARRRAQRSCVTRATTFVALRRIFQVGGLWGDFGAKGLDRTTSSKLVTTYVAVPSRL